MTDVHFSAVTAVVLLWGAVGCPFTVTWPCCPKSLAEHWAV